MPGGIRVIRGHRLSKLYGVRTKILFVNRSRSVDNESHHTRGVIFGRIRHKAESCAHFPIDDIVLGSARCMRPLPGEDPEKITVERNLFANFVLGAFAGCICDERVDRAVGFIVGTVPVQAIMPALIADEPLRKLLWDVMRRTREILFLCFNELAARIHGGKFILAHAPEYDLVLACGRIEIPRAVVVRQGNWKRPVFGSHNQGYFSIRLGRVPMHLLIFNDEGLTSIRIFRWVAGRENVLSRWSENGQRSLFVRCLHRSKEGVTGIFGGSKGSLSRLLGKSCSKRTS